MMNAFSEGLVLAGRSGLDPSVLLDVLVSKNWTSSVYHYRILHLSRVKFCSSSLLLVLIS